MRRLLLAASMAVASTTAMAQDEFSLSSLDIGEGEPLSEQFVYQGFGCEGENVSPGLSWANAPEGTESFAVTVHDPDAPTGSGWWHWVVFDIPADVTELPQGAGSGGDLPAGVITARNDYGEHAFGGACPPPDEVHRYIFRVDALGTDSLGVDESASAALIGFMIRANSLASDTITAVYTR